MGQDLVLNTMVLQLATEGLNTEVHWPGGASGVTIGPGFDIGASAVKPDDLRTILTQVGLSSASIELLVLTTKEKAGSRATGKEAGLLMQELQIKSKVKLTTQQSLDIGYIVKNRPGSSFQSTTDSAFCMSTKLLHPAYREVLVKVTYGTPALTMRLGEKYDAPLSRESDPQKQGTILLEMFAALQAEKEVSMAAREKVLLAANPSMKDFSDDSAWLSARVHRDVARGMSFFIKKVMATLASGGKVIIEDKPMTVAQLADPNDKNQEFIVVTGGVTYGSKEDDPYLQSKLKKKKAEMKAIADAGTENSKIDAAFLKVIGDKLPNHKPSRSADSKKAQIILKELGYYTGNTDGDFGKGSQASLAKYQKDKGISDAAKAKAQLIKDYDTKFPPVTPGTTPVTPTPVTPDTSDSKGWWDKITEMYEAAQKDAKITAQSWWAKILELYNGGITGFAMSLFTGGLTGTIADAYTKYQQYAQQQQQSDALKQEIQSAFTQGKGSISAKVGAGGDNKSKDVYIVRGLLFKAGYASLTLQQIFATPESRALYAKSDAALEAAIRKYQSEKVGSPNPDGRVDPDGKTIKALNGVALPPNNTNPVTPTEEEPVFQPAALDAAVFPCFN